VNGELHTTADFARRNLRDSLIVVEVRKRTFSGGGGGALGKTLYQVLNKIQTELVAGLCKVSVQFQN
jgi:hypothetical protein